MDPIAARKLSEASGSATPWTEIVARVLSTANETARRPRYVDPEAPIAFEDVLIPFVEAGREIVARDLADDTTLVADNAWMTLERALLALVSRLSLQTFCSEFALHQGLAGSMPWGGDAGAGSYRTFVTRARTGGLDDILRAYPVLARLLATAVLNWASAHAAIVTRWRDDWPRLQEIFALDDDGPCRIDSVAPYRSDLHDGGQSVVILHCRRSLVVYKPRPLAMEQALGDVLAWANAHGFSAPYRHTPLLARGSYGWMAYAAPTPCRHAAQAADFYRRAGGLICLTTLMQATDIHYENLVASGDQPVLVDAETLFHPRLPPGPDDVARLFTDSGWFPPPAGPDFSALGAEGDIATSFPNAACVAINSDRMAFRYEAFRAPRRQNVPTLNGRPAHAASYRGAIAAGFREMFGLVLRARSSLLGLIRSFGDPPGRFIARSSNAYGLLLQAALSPDALRDEAERRALFARLPASGAGTPVLAAETQALMRMDVPRIATTDPDVGRYRPSPMAQTVERIARLRERDLDTHLVQLRRHLARLSTSDTHQEARHG